MLCCCAEEALEHERCSVEPIPALTVQETPEWVPRGCTEEGVDEAKRLQPPPETAGEVGTEEPTQQQEPQTLQKSLPSLQEPSGQTLSPKTSLGQSQVFRVDSDELLRAVPLGCVMAGGGTIFADSTGTDETFALSSPTTNIHTFFSHNWSTGRIHKFLMLAQHFNTRAALGVALLVQASCMVLIVETHSEDRDLRLRWNYKRGLVWTFPVFQLALHFGRQPARACGLQGPALFLDKACIHQTDEDLKRQGVRALGAFVRASSNLLVCYNDKYLKRLWTVYEVACFLVVHGVSRIHLIPLLQPVFTLVFSVAVWLVILANELFQQALGGEHPLFPILSPLLTATAVMGCVAVATYYSRLWVRQLAELRTVMAEFDVLQADCSEEADRAVVEDNIVVMMRHIVQDDQRESRGRDELLKFFNEFVKARLPDAILAATGRVGLRYEFVLVTFLPVFSDLLDYRARYLWGNRKLRPNFVALVMTLAQYLGILPIICAVHMMMMRQCLGLKGLWEILYRGGAALVTTALAGCLYLAPEFALPFAAESDWVSAGLAAASCALVAVAAVLFRPLRVRA